MKNTIFAALGILFMLVLVATSCRNADTNKQVATTADSIAKADSMAACTTIKDPNNTKPMALMMRLMAANADSMRSQLLRGEKLDSLKYPFIKFYLVEPTDPNVLEPKFFDNARLFQESYKALFAHPNESKKYYNLMINACVNCHESYCSGPLKRIRKFPIE
jgi:hypothetical protein